MLRLLKPTKDQILCLQGVKGKKMLLLLLHFKQKVKVYDKCFVKTEKALTYCILKGFVQ